jgi:uncharacterized membrane protein
MKHIRYHNINLDLSFKTICTYLLSFWMTENKNLKNKKVWLTITVYNKQNESFVLSNNLPFTCYTDVVIVLKQIALPRYIISNIVFQYYAEDKSKNKYNWNRIILYGLVYIILVLIIIILLFIVFVIYLEISQNLNHDIITQEIIHKSNDILKEQTVNASCNRFRAESFTKMFYSPSTISCYFPSYFLPSNLRVSNSDFNLLEYILSNQYIILDYRITSFNECIEGFNDVLKQYKSVVPKDSILP